MYTTDAISRTNVPITNSSFRAVTATSPKIDQIPRKDLFSLPKIQPSNKEAMTPTITPIDAENN